MTTKADLRAQIRDLLEEREELLTEIRRLRMGNHPAGRALWATDLRPYITKVNADTAALAEALTERDAEHEGGCDVEQVNALLGINLYDVRSFRADVRIDFDEYGRVLAVSLLNPDAEHAGGGGS